MMAGALGLRVNRGPHRHTIIRCSRFSLSYITIGKSRSLNTPIDSLFHDCFMAGILLI
jgi:hypothetical protein